jgi:hypothetical protein
MRSGPLLSRLPGGPKAGFLLALALVGLGTLAFFEILLLLPLPWEIYAGFGGFWLLVVLLIADFNRARFATIGGIVLVVVLLAVLYWTPWSSRKPFLRSFDRIQAGMTAEETRSIMQNYEVRESEDTLAFRHSREGRFDSDIGLVLLEEGVVKETQFLPD